MEVKEFICTGDIKCAVQSRNLIVQGKWMLKFKVSKSTKQLTGRFLYACLFCYLFSLYINS
jgi:hypothetical protein